MLAQLNDRLQMCGNCPTGQFRGVQIAGDPPQGIRQLWITVGNLFRVTHEGLFRKKLGAIFSPRGERGGRHERAEHLNAVATAPIPGADRIGMLDQVLSPHQQTIVIRAESTTVPPRIQQCRDQELQRERPDQWIE